MKKLIICSLLLGLLLTSFPTASAAVKGGNACAKLNLTSGSGSSKFTCKKVNGKLVWVKTPTSSALGSISNPVPMGGFMVVGNFSYRIDGIVFGLDEEICASNAFNDGCTYDDNFDVVVDPESSFYWAGVTVTASNKSKVIAKPASLFLKSFSLVMPNGQLLESEIFALGDNDFSQLQVIPGGNGSGRIFFKIPKSVTSLKSLLVIRDSSSFLATKDFYFKLDW